MSRKSKRLAGRQFAGRKAKAAAKAVYVRPVFCDEIDTPHWDDDWSLHYDTESEYVEPPLIEIAPMRSETTDWCAFPLAIDAALCAGRALSDGVGLVIDEPPQMIVPVPSPLVQAAQRKEHETLLKLSGNGRPKTQLATVKPGEDYRNNTLKPYTARCAAASDFREAMRLGNDMIADYASVLATNQLAWNAVSADAVLATKQPCPAI